MSKVLANIININNRKYSVNNTHNGMKAQLSKFIAHIFVLLVYSNYRILHYLKSHYLKISVFLHVTFHSMCVEFSVVNIISYYHAEKEYLELEILKSNDDENSNIYIIVIAN